MSSKIKVDTIENVAGSGNVSLGSGHNLVVPGTLGVDGHGSIGNSSTVSGTRALTVVGASDGSGSSIVVAYNSSLASKFAVRDDGLVTIAGNTTVGGTLGVTGASTFTGGLKTGATAGVSTTVNAPSSPSDGDLWWDEEDGSLFIYYNDGDSAQWVEASPGTIADDTIVSDFFKSKVTLLIKNSAGTTLKTIFSPGV